jgi:hypothetical protein
MVLRLKELNVLCGITEDKTNTIIVAFLMGVSHQIQKKNLFEKTFCCPMLLSTLVHHLIVTIRFFQFLFEYIPGSPFPKVYSFRSDHKEKFE